MTANTDTTKFSVERLVAASRKAIPFLQAAMMTHKDAKPVRDALAAAVVEYDQSQTASVEAEFTAETYCVINTGETGWSVKHGDDTVCDVYGPKDHQKVMAERIASLLNSTQS